MRHRSTTLAALALGATAAPLFLASRAPVQGQRAPVQKNVVNTRNRAGVLRSAFGAGFSLDRSNPFFKPLGTNGRSCGTCHLPEDAWTITPESARARFEATGGLDPLFHPFDGTDSPNADRSTVAKRRAASGLLLKRGLIRVGIGIPANAEFELAAADDPYGFAHAGELSLFRRPMPTTNLRFLTGVMWDTRESSPLTGTLPVGLAALTEEQNAANLDSNLLHQSNEATVGHARADRLLTPAERKAIVAFEMSLVTAQQSDLAAGPLDADGARGGPAYLAAQPFYITINDVLGADRLGIPFDPNAMNLYDGWRDSPAPARRQIARGAALFNSKPISISGVGGLNDDLGIPALTGTCTTCHDLPNVGNHSVAFPINIGLAAAARRTADMPLYTLRNRATGETVQTTDPGRAMITGRWRDIGKFKGPVLRGLAARAPYFHDGSAASLEAAVEFYDTRFGIGFTRQEKAELAAFLKTL